MNPKLLLPFAALLAACGTDVSGPSGSLFSCLIGDPVALEPGEVMQVSGTGNAGLCLSTADQAGAEFVYVPFFATASPGDESVELAVDLTGLGFRAAAGPPSPSEGAAARMGRAPTVILEGASSPAGPLADAAFHARLRRKEIAELEPLLKPGRVALPSPAASMAPAAAPEVGDLRTFNVAISCTQEDLRRGRVEYVSDRSVVVADVENPIGLTSDDYRHFALTFDTLVDPVEVQHFGEPTDIDANGRAIIFITRAVNELSDPAGEVFTAGFFWSGDLFPEADTDRAQGCPAANQAEMFYILSADPLGEAGPVFEVDFVRRAGVGIIAHEYQHLINAARRLWVNEASEFEEPWLNEGLSHVAEELMFYAVSGLEPGSNLGHAALSAAEAGITAFNAYMAGNFSNYARYLERPDTNSLMGIDELPTRGAAWNFLRYAADRSGRSDDAFFHDLVNAQRAGLVNLERVLGTGPLAWMQDWTVSVYADDAVAVDARYTQQSWNFRNLYPNSSIGRFPLDVIPLTASSEQAIRLLPGGAAFPRFGLGPGARGIVLVESEGALPPASLRGSFLRTR